MIPPSDIAAGGPRDTPIRGPDDPGPSGGDIGVAIPAAGRGRRMGGVDKAFLELAGVPLLRHALRTFLEVSRVRRIVVALSEDHADRPASWLTELDPRIRVVAGGRTRSESVRIALEGLEPSIPVALVHDAARPLVTDAIVRRCVDAVGPGVGAVAGWPVVDTLKEVDSARRIVDSPDRARFWRAQTPQAFLRAELLDAYRRALDAGFTATDDAAVFAWAGGGVRMVEGDPWNLKVTHPEDVRVAEVLLGGTWEGPSP